MENADMYLCKFAKTCRYGTLLDNQHYSCGYILVTGKSRVKDNPAGEIVDGKCGMYEEIKNARERCREKTGWAHPEMWWRLP